MATHSSTLVRKIPWVEKPGAGYSQWGHKELDMTEWLYLLTYYAFKEIEKYAFYGCP